MANKILFIGDLHLSDRQISTRVDDTTETCLEKLQWILHFAMGCNADIIHTGDMFTHTLYSNTTRLAVKRMLRSYKNSGLCFFSCSGNHSGDIEDRDSNSVITRELGQFVFDGYVNFLGSFDGFPVDDYFCTYDSVPLSVKIDLIRGYSAYAQLDTSYADRIIGLVCHHWIMDAFGDSLVVYPDDMKKVFPNLRFIVSGHDHAYHEPYYSRDGVYVVRPGSVMRTDSGKSSDRIPSVELYTPNVDFSIEDFMKIPIGCARPYSEVFYSEKKQTDVDSVSAISKFVRQMQDCSGSVMDINSAIKEQLNSVPVEDQKMIRTDLATQGFLV